MEGMGVNTHLLLYTHAVVSCQHLRGSWQCSLAATTDRMLSNWCEEADRPEEQQPCWRLPKLNNCSDVTSKSVPPWHSALLLCRSAWRASLP